MSGMATAAAMIKQHTTPPSRRISFRRRTSESSSVSSDDDSEPSSSLISLSLWLPSLLLLFSYSSFNGTSSSGSREKLLELPKPLLSGSPSEGAVSGPTPLALLMFAAMKSEKFSVNAGLPSDRRAPFGRPSLSSRDPPDASTDTENSLPSSWLPLLSDTPLGLDCSPPNSIPDVESEPDLDSDSPEYDDPDDSSSRADEPVEDDDLDPTEGVTIPVKSILAEPFSPVGTHRQ
mmetsp:Transcript_20043/g.56816  ORF Transcript_20043/g.56816 Transcript_20043/m.56816 type:complete len:233 (+) Transcript_20043:1750-2448(+)